MYWFNLSKVVSSNVIDVHWFPLYFKGDSAGSSKGNSEGDPFDLWSNNLFFYISQYITEQKAMHFLLTLSHSEYAALYLNIIVVKCT
jgi:hypothetical protein